MNVLNHYGFRIRWFFKYLLLNVLLSTFLAPQFKAMMTIVVLVEVMVA